MWIAYGNAKGNKLYNNTLYDNVGDCIRVRTDKGASVRNNICWKNSRNQISDETGTAIISHNFFSDPLFRSVAQGDFGLSAYSGCINAGIGIDTVSRDFSGVSRPQGGAFDIGAFEYSGSTQILVAPTSLRIVD
jgi:hypothetical protein